MASLQHRVYHQQNGKLVAEAIGHKLWPMSLPYMMPPALDSFLHMYIQLFHSCTCNKHTCSKCQLEWNGNSAAVGSIVKEMWRPFQWFNAKHFEPINLFLLASSNVCNKKCHQYSLKPVESAFSEGPWITVLFMKKNVKKFGETFPHLLNAVVIVSYSHKYDRSDSFHHTPSLHNEKSEGKCAAAFL